MNNLNLSDDMKVAWYHAALVLSKKISIGSVQANEDLKNLLEQFGTIEKLYDHHFSMVPVHQDIEYELNKCYSKFNSSFKAITIHDDLYPKALRKIRGTPAILYCQGNVEIFELEKSIGFVGTRELDNPNHIESARNAIKRIYESGFEVIVSGLATGSDTLGHKCAIQLGMKTIAVLGTPLNISYPKENKELQANIALNHLLVTEYPIGVRPFGTFFSNRNMTTVSLSQKGIIVARAGDKSGTQHAIRHCVNQNKPLYILENNIYEKDYTWVRKYKDKIKLIRDK